MKKLTSILVVLVCCLFIVACSKEKTATNDTPQMDPDNYDLVLPDDLEEHLAESGSAPMELSRVLDADGNPLGRTTQSVKDDIIYTMIKKGLTLCLEKGTKVYPYEGERSPEQKGLAYSFGQRDPYQRLLPPHGNDIHRGDSVFGVDCSGLMYVIAKHSGIDLTTGVTTRNFVQRLSEGVRAASTNNNIMGVLDLGKISQTDFKPGDFILWPGHVGMICIASDGEIVVIQSNGKSNPSTVDVQKLNRGPNRGVHSLGVKKALSHSWFGTNYRIIRIVNAGDVMFGGYLFSIDDNNTSGLVCALEDQAQNVELPDAFTAGTSTDYGKGLANTTLLITTSGDNNAIGKCFNLISEGYDDWYMPSRDELLRMIGKLKYNNMGNIGDNSYWSSSDKGASFTAAGTYYPCSAYSVSFDRSRNEAISISDFKNKKYNVRAVRKFKTRN